MTEPFTGILGEIEEVAGREAAVALSIRYGGRRLYIPKRIRQSDRLSQEISEVAARALADRFGGTYIDLPIGAGIKAQIRMLRGLGLTIAQISSAVHRTERYVYSILSNRAADPVCRQRDLFD